MDQFIPALSSLAVHGYALSTSVGDVVAVPIEFGKWQNAGALGDKLLG
jgi:hypothetical protein